ncbi:MAG: hypothetical protein CVV64_19090 [Candidatus Wallbacteria bacterium HGW-Wallbacteria-1]|jgi:hypothetical protein|uniref:GGDEF domain-containing protein n=1 Tax=Candidatus Wallbacteria bacterium HGW-Wallbacteria-1 TaxID=2013854 RepID=A0A2N1PJ25_9BACT|nr:MAG: hypothetical protein CVV64_19090 [Candidatus Wallbacteria bacterium HGW-Wallbacteria-1]
MAFTLDIRSIMLFNTFLTVFLAFFMVYSLKTQKTYPGYLIWTISSICLGSGTLLISLRNFVPPFVSIVIANILLSFCYILLKRGTEVFFSAKTHSLIDGLLMALFACSFVYFTINPDIKLRIATILIFNSYIFSCLAVILARGTAAVFEKTDFFLVGEMLLMVILALIMLFSVHLFCSPHIQDICKIGNVYSFQIMVISSLTVIVYLSLISLNNRKLSWELARSEKESSELRKLLPICSHCRKIRTKTGDWHDFDRYISSTEAIDFTHSFCDNCAETLYPELMD